MFRWSYEQGKCETADSMSDAGWSTLDLPVIVDVSEVYFGMFSIKYRIDTYAHDGRELLASVWRSHFEFRVLNRHLRADDAHVLHLPPSKVFGAVNVEERRMWFECALQTYFEDCRTLPPCLAHFLALTDDHIDIINMKATSSCCHSSVTPQPSGSEDTAEVCSEEGRQEQLARLQTSIDRNLWQYSLCEKICQEARQHAIRHTYGDSICSKEPSSKYQNELSIVPLKKGSWRTAFGIQLQCFNVKCM